jgi:hypothetical protein
MSSVEELAKILGDLWRGLEMVRPMTPQSFIWNYDGKLDTATVDETSLSVGSVTTSPTWDGGESNVFWGSGEWS